MTQGQIQRIDALPPRSKATVHYKRDSLPMATVRGVLYGRAAGSASSTPWVVAGSGYERAVGYVSPYDEATVAVAAVVDCPEVVITVEV